MTTWLNVLAIAAGGAFGAVGRYTVTVASAALPGGSTFLGTTIANLLGCAAIGALAVYVELGGAVGERLSLALRVGFLGGLTTFSTFAAESSGLALEGRWLVSGIYLAANLVIGWIVLLGAAGLMRTWMAT